MSDELKALAERVQALAGPCRETDALIRKAVYAPPTAYVEQSPLNGAWVIYNGTQFRSGRPAIWEGPGRDTAFTASLDAAMTLVPEGHDVLCHLYFGRNGEGSAIVTRLKQINLPRVFAATPALALTAAALLARASIEHGSLGEAA